MTGLNLKTFTTNVKKRKKGYAKIGYEKAEEELKTWFNEQVEKIKVKELNNRNQPIVIDDDEYEEDKLWIELF